MNMEDRDIIAALKKLALIQPRKSFSARIEADVRQLPQTLQTSRISSWTLLPVAQIAIALVIFLFITSVGVVVASDRSNPGDILYPVKKAVESAQVAVASSPTARAILQIHIAGKRVREMKDVVDTNKNSQELDELSHEYEMHVDQSLAELDSASSSAATARENVVKALEKHEETLQTVKNEVPEDHQASIDRAIDASQKGQEAVQTHENSDHNNQPSQGSNASVQGVSSLEAKNENSQQSHDNGNQDHGASSDKSTHDQGNDKSQNNSEKKEK